MKTMATQLSLLLRIGQRKSNTRLLIKFVCVLAFFFVTYSILFHVLMLYEGREYSCITGFYWTLTTMSTLNPKLENRPLNDIQIRENTGCSVVAISRHEQSLINPDPTIVLEPGDELVLIGTAESEKVFAEHYAKTT